MTSTPGIDAPIAVVCATGQQGGAVVDALVERGASVRALVRDPQADKARAIAGRGVDLVWDDLTDPASLDALLDGVAAGFAMTTMAGPNGIEADIEGVRRLVPDLFDLPAWLAQSGWTPGR